MLEESRNRILTEVGAGTPMGELLRRYWHPIAALSQLDESDIVPVRLLGEDLVLYRDRGGRLGLVDRHCPHRGADLAYGFVEDRGIRCNYHGWLYDETGRCAAQPFEETADADARFKDKVTIKAYRAEALAGLVWAYLGPNPAPLVPNWEPFTWKNGFVQIVFSEVPCNWFQCQENSIDPVHFEWMHDNWKIRLEDRDTDYAPKHRKIAFDEFDYGFTYRRVREGSDETSPLWTVGRVCLWPYALFTGGHFEWRVPIDDETTLSVAWFYNRVPREREPFVQETIPYWTSPVTDPKTGRWITSHIMNQDFVAWVGQGTVTDRTREHLGRSDRGILMIRKRFFDDIEAVTRGEDPKAVIRDPELNRCLDLPIVEKQILRDGLPGDERDDPRLKNVVSPRRFVHLAGQPEPVRRAYEAAMGFEMEDGGFVENG